MDPTKVCRCDLCRAASEKAPGNCICATCEPGEPCKMVLSIHEILAVGECVVHLADFHKKKGHACAAYSAGRHYCEGCIVGCLAYGGACYLDIVYYYPERYDTPRDATGSSN